MPTKETKHQPRNRQQKMHTVAKFGIGALVIIGIAAIAYFIYYEVTKNSKKQQVAKAVEGVVSGSMGAPNSGAAEAQRRAAIDAQMLNEQRYGVANDNVGAYPDSSDPQGSLYPHMAQEAGRGAMMPEDPNHNMEVDKLMPTSWRLDSNAGCPQSESEDQAEWTRYAPSREAFNNYITAAGSARMSLNTRSPMARQVGLANPLRPGVKVPLGGYQSDFLDTDMRQTAIYNATGQYPESLAC